MLEVELKFRVKNPSEIEERVSRICEFVGEGMQRDVYFNAPDRDFRETDEALRIREDGNECSLWYKGPKVGRRCKSRKELKVTVGDRRSAEALLLALGYRRVGEIVKFRRTYRCGRVNVCIDKVRGLGWFVEIECSGRRVRELERRVMDFASALGLNPGDGMVKSYLELKLLGSKTSDSEIYLT